MRHIVLSILISFALISCKKEKPGTQNILKCGELQNRDSAAISAKLTGTWIWKKQSIPNTNMFKDADKNIEATFNTDSTFTITENSNVIIQGTWKLINYGSFYGFRADPYNQYLYGAVYFCDNQLLFSNSIADGLDNLFER